MPNVRFTDWHTNKPANGPADQLIDWRFYSADLQLGLVDCWHIHLSSGTEQPNLSQLWTERFFVVVCLFVFSFIKYHICLESGMLD